MTRANWQMWSGGLSPHDLAQIEAAARGLNISPATVFNSDTSVRSSDVGWLTGNMNVQSILWKYVQAANENAFHVDVENVCDIQYTEYPAVKGGHYDWHIDTYWLEEGPQDRKLSVTIQLSHSDEYEGGEFQFSECETPDASSRVKGTVLIFPSYLLHRVLPVKSGLRKSLVAWFQGPRWK